MSSGQAVPGSLYPSADSRLFLSCAAALRLLPEPLVRSQEPGGKQSLSSPLSARFSLTPGPARSRALTMSSTAGGRFLPSLLSAGSARGSGQRSAQGVTPDGAPDLFSAPASSFSGAGKCLASGSSPRQCLRLAPCRAAPQNRHHAFLRDPGILPVLRLPGAAGCREAYGEEQSGEPNVKIISLPLRQTAHSVRYRGDPVSDMERRMPDRCIEYGCCGTAGNCSPDPADPPIFSFSMRDPRCSGFCRAYRSLFRKDPALFPESLMAGSRGCCSVLPDPRSAQGSESGAGMRLPFLTMMKEPDGLSVHVRHRVPPGNERAEETAQGLAFRS